MENSLAPGDKSFLKGWKRQICSKERTDGILASYALARHIFLGKMSVE